MRKLDESESHMSQLVELKIASFFYYLKHYKLRGYGKWTVLSNCVKEMHPQDLSLLDLVHNKMKDDEIFQGLKTMFTETFLDLTEQEAASLMTRTGEFKDLQKKAVYLSYIIMNLSPATIKEAILVWY